MRTSLRIGAGAGYSGDRIEPAVELAERGALDYLVFECLAERTIALAQQARRRAPGAGLRPAARGAHARRAARGAARRRAHRHQHGRRQSARRGRRKTAQIARELGWAGMQDRRGDSATTCSTSSAAATYRFEETGDAVAALGERIVSANAYLGCAPIVEALGRGADVVVTGRAADPALFLARSCTSSAGRWTTRFASARARWSATCSSAPARSPAAISPTPDSRTSPASRGSAFRSARSPPTARSSSPSCPAAGGQVTPATCKEQLLYEIHDPARYLQPDVVADFSQVEVESIGADRVRVRGGRGTPRTDRLKVSVGYIDGCDRRGPDLLRRAGRGRARAARRSRSFASGSRSPACRATSCAST